MTRTYKKQKERVYANSTAQALGEDWEIEDVSEPLDFIVRLPQGEHFGLEVMELYDSPADRGGAALKHAHGRQQRYLRDISAGYYRAGGRPIRVNFLGRLHSVEKIIAALISVSSSLTSNEICLNICGLKAWILPLPMADTRFRNYDRWQIVEAGFVRLIPDDLVRQQVDRKSQKLTDYKKKADLIDLLLVIDRSINAGRFTISENLSLTNTGFRRVILHNYPLDARILALT